MTVETAADRAAFVNPDEFGLEATWTVAGEEAASLNAVFDEASETRFAGPGVDVVSPMIVVRTADIPGNAAAGEYTGDRIAIGERTFIPRTIEPDGTGMSRVLLEEDLTS